MKHIPVLLNEVAEALAIQMGGTYVDGTLGRGGHAAEILKRAQKGAFYVGIDRDPTALTESAENLRGFTAAHHITLVHGTHGNLAALARESGVQAADGILLDLGVSSPQLDDPARGFSFQKEGPLDMRMDPTQGETAAEILATRDAAALTEIFRTLGEEPAAKRIAEAIIRARASTPFQTTSSLATFIEKLIGRHGAHHPATRVFQALRMAVNDELGELARALTGGIDLLKVGGRMAVITFESITDRFVKHFFAAHIGKTISLQQGGERWEGELPRVKCLTKHAVVATEAEVNLNSRSRSAKLRVIERIES